MRLSKHTITAHLALDECVILRVHEPERVWDNWSDYPLSTDDARRLARELIEVAEKVEVQNG